jgi:hypothetical protein
MGKATRNRRKKQRRLRAVPGGPTLEAEVLDQLLHELAAAGAPDDLIGALREATDPVEALQALADSGRLPSPEESFAGMVEGFGSLLAADIGALDAELCGAEFLGVVRRLAEDGSEVPEMLRMMAGQAEDSGLPEALAMLRSVGAVGPQEVREELAQAADRMVAAGLRDCAWVGGLGAPKVGRAFGYGDIFGSQESVAVTFSYGRKQHAIVVLIDHGLGGGIKDCFVTDEVRRIRLQFKTITAQAGLTLVDYDPEQAHMLLSDALSREPCPVQRDQVEDLTQYFELLRSRVALLGEAAAAGKPSAATGKVHRVKVTLRGSKPPIWRRLEVPSAATLDQLHEIIQRAFGWDGSHLWAFETWAGTYGIPDPELGHRSAMSATLADLAKRKGSRLCYVYDFGDDWVHDIEVEGVLPAEPGVAYPRCVTGRRACPPEDCGGIWGYARLLEVLADPSHEEHEDLLQLIGLESPEQFDPAAFGRTDIDEALADVARVLIMA